MNIPLRKSVSSVAPWILEALILSTSISALSQSLAPGTGRFGVGTKAAAPALPTISSSEGLSVDIQNGGGWSVAAPALTFASSKDTATAPQVFTLTNTTNDTVLVDTTGLTGPAASDFNFTGCANYTLKNKESCDVTVTYSPREAISGKSSLGFQLVNQNTGTTTSASLQLIGQYLQVRIDLPVALSAAVKVPSSPQTITIKNVGTDTITIQEHPPVVTGDNASEFDVSGCRESVLGPGAKCTLTVVFTPTAAGVQTALITLPLSSKDYTNARLSIPLSGSQTCSQPSQVLLPLSRGDVSNDTINCYFNASTNLAFVSQVRYFYNPGGSANTLSSDLASLQFPGGVQLNLEGSATVNSCSTPTASGATTNSSCNGTGTSPASTTAIRTAWRSYDTTTATGNDTTSQSLEQAVQSLTKGGDFGLRAVWPVVNYRSGGMQLVSVFQPRVGFSINGITGQNTITGATEVNTNFANETYFQLNAIPAQSGQEAPGSIFVDYRAGWEHVSSTFAASAGLPGSNFALQQFSAGVVYKGAIRLSAQRYFGPSQAYVNASGNTVKTNNFSNWQLAVQITPTNVFNGGKK